MSKIEQRFNLIEERLSELSRKMDLLLEAFNICQKCGRKDQGNYCKECRGVWFPSMRMEPTFDIAKVIGDLKYK